MEPRSLRVLLLADAVAEDLPGGSRTAARAVAHGLTKRGHRVTFLVGRQTPDAPDDVTVDGVRIMRYPGAGSLLGFVRAGRDACRGLLRASAFDIVHTHFAYAGVGPLGALPPAVARVRTFHGPWDREGWLEDTFVEDGQALRPAQQLKAQVKRLGRREIERRSLLGSDKVFTLSRCFSDMAAEYGVAPKRLALIPGGTDTDAFSLLPGGLDAKRALRHTLGLPEDAEILLSVRRLAPRMGLDNLVKAMPEILMHCPNAHLVVGGKGPEESHLRALVGTLGLESSVQLAGFIPAHSLASYYQAADLFVLPTLALEGFGLVTTEALACGLPVVGTPAGATPEILVPLDPRLVTRGTTPRDLADAVSGFLAGDWRQGLTPERLRAYVLDRYTWDKHTDATVQIYRELLAKPGRE